MTTAKIKAEIKASEVWRLSPDTFAENASRGTWKPYRHLSLIADTVRRELRKGGARVIISCPPRHGKALHVDTPIQTTRGLKRISDLKAGDQVFHPCGYPVRVIFVSEVWRNRKLFNVSTDDGASVLADENHLWTVRLCRKYKKWSIHDTAWLAARKSSRRAMIPRAQAIRFKEKKLPIPPYTLGAWLGDGRTNYGSITQSKADAPHILGRIQADGFTIRKQGEPCQYGILGLQARLRSERLLGDKRIPECYFQASPEQRLALLQGLADTDGYVAKDGQIEICSILNPLAIQIQRLVRSLGAKASFVEGNATIDGRFISKKYRVMFYLARAASLPRKAIKCRDGVKQPNRYLSFERAGFGDTICIQVDSLDGMFLAGDGLIPTHNSELLSHWLPVWFLDLFPEKRIILASYGDKLARFFGRKVKNELTMNEMVTVRAKQDSLSSTEIETTDGGGMMVSGIGGAITGRGGDLIIIDDPIKTLKEAMSETVRQSQIEWFNSVLYTRLEPGGSIIVILTRWHENDLAGYLLTSHHEKWTEINLKAIAEEADGLGRDPGEALCPERYTIDDLLRIKEAIGSRMFAALYQGKPSPQEGAIWKRTHWKRWTTLPEDITQYFQSWDATQKEDGSSFVVGQVWAKAGARKYLIDQIRGKWGFTETILKFRQLSAKWPKAERKLVEAKANGPAIEDQLGKEIHGIILVEPKGGKEVRAMSCEPDLEAGNVFVPTDEVAYPWVRDFIEEAAMFPNGKNDDQVDAASQAIVHMKGHGEPVMVGRDNKRHTTGRRTR